MNSRCQVDLIDMQVQADREYRFIMVYQDHLTKFVLLRALQTKRAEEVAHHLTDIFLTFGAPCILHSDNGREFVNSVIKELATLWLELKLVNGKPRHSQSQGSVERANQDIEKMLASWMLDNKTTKWSNGLRYVQFMKNRAFHSGIKQSPYRAMFGIDPRVGLATSNLTKDILENIEEEEDLQRVINDMNKIDENLMEIETQSEIDDNQIDIDTQNEIDENQIEIETQNEIESEVMIETQNEIDSEVMIETQNEIESEIINNRNEIKSARRKAFENLNNQAKKMKRASNASHPPVKVGDNVLIPIPDVDRAKADFRNVIGVVLEKNEDLHKIGTKNGKVDKLYCRSEFDVWQETFLLPKSVPDVRISLRTAARKAAITPQGFTRCSCKKSCTSNRCLFHSSAFINPEQ
ncbi:KRAB-A domain-containing protein 2-like [Leptopilina heterotoma]|uniref:KRAB-A domain-containing protein 2-like n=1 Tax=Leptopilina heterotoma TaxID=63436 RepID=UPI001CA9BFC3|nr:KRAB-A domain-containing protein 2-like [Leptopilina heterotoma]